MSDQHQGLPVSGYRPQTQQAVNLVNDNKLIEERILRHLDDLARVQLDRGPVDPRWLAIGRTHLEQAFMCINRAIFQPERVTLPEDDR